MYFLRHAGGIDLLLQFVVLALFAAAQFLLDGLDLLVEVILFLRALHLPLDAGLYGAIHVQLFDFDIENIGDAIQALGRIEDLQQFLLFFDRELQVRGDRIGQARRIFHAHSRDHGLVIQRLAELHVLLEQRRYALHRGFNLRRDFGRVLHGADSGFEVAVRVRDLQNFAAFHALDQHLDVAIGQLQALDDVDDGADLVDLARLGLVDAGVMLSREKDLLISGQSLFQCAYARLATNYERRHHVRKNDDVANGHHREPLGFEFFFGLGHLNRL